MTTPDTDQRHLAELRTQWHNARAAGDDELLAAIEDEGAQIKALRLITAVFPDAVVLETNNTEQSTIITTERTATP